MPRTQKKVSKHCFGSGRLIFYWIFGDINENLIGCCSKPACGMGKSLLSGLPITCVYYIQHWSSKILATVCSQLGVFSIYNFRGYNKKILVLQETSFDFGDSFSEILTQKCVLLLSVFVLLKFIFQYISIAGKCMIMHFPQSLEQLSVLSSWLDM